MKTVLYISYDGMTDPLGQSQVIPYLTGLAKRGHRITVLSCEKRHHFALLHERCEKALADSGIEWVHVPYSKRPPVLSTYFDLARMRRLGNKLSAGRQFDIVHCRTILSALIGQEMARRLGAKLIFDMRGFWADERVEGSLWNLSNPIYRRLFAYFKRKERQFFREADLVITLTARAKEFIKSPDYGPGDVDLEAFVQLHNPNTTDISSTIYTDRYVPVNPYSNARRLTLGWSGSHSTSKYLHLLDEVLRHLAQEVDFQLKVIGDPNFTMEGVDVSAQEWQERTEVQDLQAIDIGLYPLPDEEWVLGKSGLKALQYMALGIPTVATGIGANSRIIRDGENGFLVSDPSEWKNRLLQLVSDPELRGRIGRNATRTVSERFSLRANQDTYLRVLDTVFGGKQLSSYEVT